MGRDIFEKEIETFDSVLRGLGLGYKIDELAFIKELPEKAEGHFTKFNEGDDRVLCSSLIYDVHYEWLQSNNSRVRIERMEVTSHQGPFIHEDFEPGMVIHASFKTKTYEEYVDACRALYEKLSVQETFSSSYGLFTYFHIPGVCGFLKPRLNMRDAMER